MKPGHLAIRPLCAEAENRARQLAKKLNARLVDAAACSQLPPDAVVLDVDREDHYLRLADWPDRARLKIDFLGGKLGYRQAQLGRDAELLRRATGATSARRLDLLDATAGLGSDALMLAALGFRVTALERQSVLAFLLGDALQRAIASGAAPAHLHQLHFVNADSREWLAANPQRFEVIYLDPMFPQRTKSAQVKKSMQLLQVLAREEEGAERELLERALQNAIYRVVVKRPLRAPVLAEKQRTHQLAGSKIRFDIYGLRSMSELS